MSTDFSSVNKKDKIIKFVQDESKKGYYPTHSFLENKFKTNIRTHFSDGIREVYKLAKVKYIRDPNPFLKYKKEKILTNICIKILRKLRYKIKFISISSSKHGPDLIVQKKNQNNIPVEIKAYQKYGKIGIAPNSPYFTNEITQLQKYIKKLNSPFGILITSTDKGTFKRLPKNVKIFFGKDIEKFLIKYKFFKELKQLRWIKNSHVSIDKAEKINKIRNDIIKFVGHNLQNRKYIGKREILKTLGINVYTYFNSMKEIYKNFDIDTSTLPRARMGGNVNKEIMRKRILDFFREKVKEGKYPTYKEIQRTFSCLPKLFFSDGIREIYRILGLNYDRKFAAKTKEERKKIRKKIIEFVKESSKSNFKPTYKDIKMKFEVGIQNYFKKGIGEVYNEAGVEIGPRKGLRR